MINKDVLKRIFVYFFVIFTLLINLSYLFFSINYEKGNYSEYNTSTRMEFYKNTPWEKINFQELCSSLKPNLFLQNYNKIVFLSLLMIIVSIVAIHILYKRKFLSKKQGCLLITVVILSFLVFFKAFLIEADYDFIGCGKFW
ncbi:MAG: hypothetical protein V1732_01865 [Patescibacteria group bacterium]|nr:hypothetical protein [Patescibacteria group bacterium]